MLFLDQVLGPGITTPWSGYGLSMPEHRMREHARSKIKKVNLNQPTVISYSDTVEER